MKKALPILAFVCALSASCQKNDDGFWFRKGNTNEIGVLLSDFSIIATRSGDASEQLFDSFVIDSIGDQTIRIDAFVSDFCPEDLGMETKGAITTNSKITQFWMNAYADAAWYDNTIPDGNPGSLTNPNTAGEYFIKKNVSRPSTSSSNWSIADKPKWLNDIPMSFWSWSGVDTFSTPDPGLTVNDDHDEISFNYINNGSIDLVWAFNNEKRAFNNRTGIISGGTGTYNESYKDAMNIKFYHALAAARFDISGLKDNGFTIKKIKFKGVIGQADCTVKVGTGGELDFDWEASSSANISSADLTASDFSETGVDGSTANALMPMTSDKFVFLIPQDVQGEGITVEITYENASGEEIVSEASLDHSTPWEAGKYYTYKLSIDDGVSITVSDTVTATLKSNVSIKNDGNKSAFVRASIVAYWVDASGNYLSNCNYKSQGTLVGFNNQSKWVEASDGFFYYNGEVEPDDDIGPSLLTSYAPAAAPISGATLKMVITAQAIKYDSTKTSCYDAFNN